MKNSYYIESPEFNDFLEMFDSEELKEECCGICNNKVQTRKSVESERYICLNCVDKIIDEYVNK